MSWVYLDDQFPDHPKVARAGEAAAYLFVCGLAYCKRHGTDGDIAKPAALRLVTSRARALAARLVDAGLWEDAGDHFRVHDYAEWNRPAASRSEAGRKAARARWSKDDASRTHNASDPQCDRIESAHASTCTIPIPSLSLANSSSNGSGTGLPDGLWMKVAEEQLKLQRPGAVSNPERWLRTAADNAEKHLTPKAVGLLEQFNVSTSQLACALATGITGPTWNSYRRDAS